MNKQLLRCLWVLLGGLVIMVICAMIIGRRSEPEVETEPEIIVRATIEEETTHEEETTTVAVAATKRAAVVVPETTEAETEVPSYSVEELADYVLDHGINGPEREEYLGDRYEEVQAWIDENYVPPVRYSEPYEADDDYYPTGGGVLTPGAGVNYYAGRMETYYNLDMSGVLDIMYSLGYSGDYWVRYDGCKMFGEYIMCACDFGWMPRGSVVLTSLGWAIVCDTGAGGSNWIDIAVTW